MMKELTQKSRQAMEELLQAAHLIPGNVVVIGCSSSEILGEKIGTHSSTEAAQAVLDGILPVLKENQLFLAAQCCEHLNRALIVEQELAERLGIDIVNVVPQPKAGGSFATAAYLSMQNPVAVEHIRADAGLDIGDTFIGMHIREVAVPVRLSLKEIGSAHLTAVRRRPKSIGGERAVYNPKLK